MMSMESLYTEIKAIQCWLRDHPNVEHDARWHFITKLNELNEKLNQIQNGNNNIEQTSERINT